MNDADPTLRNAAAKTKRHVGVALTTLHFEEAEYQRLAARQFDSLTAENQMKWETVEPEPGQFAFERGDELVAFAAQNQMRVRGHTLVWHIQLASWVQRLEGDALGAAMRRHVQRTAEHWRGKIRQWDVVNEALGDGGEPRKNSPFTALGMGYIADAFRAAHEADPEAQLFYNDYDIEDEGTPKAEAAYALVKQLKHDGVPIHGVGLQMHVDPRRWPAAERIQHNLERYAALGLAIEITEMDVPVGEIPGTLEQKLAEQGRLTHDIVAACLAVPACSGITFWGLDDRHSWLNIPQYAAMRGQGPHLPLPFDGEYRPKPMYARALDAFSGR
jgi:endo-1,4-beta-xylanase